MHTNAVVAAPFAATNATERNHLLAALAPEDFLLLAPHLGETWLDRGTMLQEPGRITDRVYFPHGGLISLIGGASAGHTIDTATIGREGAIGLMAGLGSQVATGPAMVQLPGPAAYVAAARLAEAAEQSAGVRDMIVRYNEVLLAQVQQVAVCSAVHRLEERLCRWLVDAADRVGGTLALTQEHLAEILGVQRTTITMICRRLQADGVINVRRGRILLHDAAALEARSCGCARIAHRLLEQNIPHHGLHPGDLPGTRRLEVC